MEMMIRNLDIKSVQKLDKIAFKLLNQRWIIYFDSSAVAFTEYHRKVFVYIKI